MSELTAWQAWGPSRRLTLLLIPAIFAAACGEADSTTTAEQPTASATTAEETEAQTPASGAPETEGPEPQGDSEEEAKPAQPPRAPAAATPEEAIRAVLTAAGDPDQACTDFVTSQFVSTAYGGRANCVAARRPNALADSLSIAEEGAGKFTVIPDGGPYDGVEVTVEVVEEDGYRVSSLLADIPAGP